MSSQQYSIILYGESYHLCLHNNIVEHVTPSPSNPESQVHVKLPSVSEHRALTSQLSVPVEHSSISVNRHHNRSPSNWKSSINKNYSKRNH